MQVINFTELRKNLKEIMDQSAENYEPVIINRANAETMVMLSLRDYESLKETIYLLGNEANAKHLRQSIRSLDEKKAKVRKLIEE